MSKADIQFGCTDRMAELCALAAAGELSADEWNLLESHLDRCSACARLMADYKALATDGMATAAASRAIEPPAGASGWNCEAAEAKFLAAVTTDEPPTAEQPAAGFGRVAGFFSLSRLRLGFVQSFAGAAAVLGIAIFVGFHFGYQRASVSAARTDTSYEAREAGLRRQIDSLRAQRDALSQNAAAQSALAGSLQEQAAQAERKAAELESLKAGLTAKLDTLRSENQQQSSTVAELTNEKTSLQQQLQQTEDSLRSVRQNLNGLQQERQRYVLRAASLENEVDRLSARLRDAEQSSQHERQYLASDRDVRELMGARQLYIADVFDVDSQGKAKKPFGRVFYTKGKSLIFYAFDLEREPGYREAKAFQAWGRSGATQATPVSLGIFYLDNESNRRWALKFDDPKVLDEINAVFVTVEPKGGSRRPTSKPFLLAYLHSASVNHP